MNKPKGELVTQTLAMPAATNANGDIFGGWIVSQMDLAGAIVATQRAQCRTTTVAIDAMTFHLPVYVADLVSCYAEVIKVGRTSMTIDIETWAKHVNDPPRMVTEAIFTFVAIDADGKPQPVDR